MADLQRTLNPRVSLNALPKLPLLMHRSVRLRLGVFLAAAIWAATGLWADPAVGVVVAPASLAPDPLLAEARTAAEKALARPDLLAYRGWIKFLRYEAETAVARTAKVAPAAAEKVQRLADWVARISADPKILATLTGPQEWAYESPVDDSGQPFKIVIPSDYDPAHPAALSVYMHGYSGNHLEHSVGWTSKPGVFLVSVLGRSRGGGYRALSEADVLQVIDYVQAHWSIDPNRISLNGGSMGGGGTYRLGSRYPQRFSSGRPSCGYASLIPVGNLLTLPLYATHSADDWTVSILHERGPLARLRELGGKVIFDETNGYGHAVWNYKEGNERGAAWEKLQVRPDSRTVRRIDYTATDGAAVRGWWGEVAEWGAAARPARFVLVADTANLLHAELTNINRLRLRLAESPFDPAQALQVSVNGAVPVTLPAPLPAEIVLARSGSAWTFDATDAAPSWRRHTPGGANLLYDGEPLLIVYGTHGTEAEVSAMRAAAEAASKSPSAAWVDDSGDAGADGVPHSQNLYGRLPTKSDTAVTDADLVRCHLVLIGTAAQNSIVARLAPKLPVRLENGAATCSDGVSFPGSHLALGLVHYNPLAADRLIFWVASQDPAAYAANSAVAAVMNGGPGYRGSVTGIDLVVLDCAAQTLPITRSFDSAWNWLAGRETSPLLPTSIRTGGEVADAVGRAIRAATGADFAITDNFGPADKSAVMAEWTRVCDLSALYYHTPIGVFDLTGAELQSAAQRLATAKGSPLAISPAPGGAKLVADHHYRVAIPADFSLWNFGSDVQLAPASYRLSGQFVDDALERFLAKD